MALQVEDQASQHTELKWLPDSQKIYNELQKRCGTGELKIITTSYQVRKHHKSIGKQRFPDIGALEDLHKVHEFALFHDEAAMKAVGVCQFGPYSEGPTGFAHGGAIATLVDIVTAITSWTFKLDCRTGNLNVNYRRSIPLNSAVLLEVWKEKVEGRKHWINYKMMSADGGTVYSDGVALWIELKSKL